MSLSNLQSRVDRLDGVYTAQKAQRDTLEQKISELKVDIDVLVKTSAVLKLFLDTLIKDEIENMAGLITFGLKSVFHDQNLTFLPKITKKNDKIHIELKTGVNGRESEFGSFGGSVAVIESFLLRVLCIIKKKMARLIILDETFGSVGDAYIPNTSELICQLCKKLGMDVLLVTHQKEFANAANKVYRVKESDKGLLMETVK
jgi:DNA repair exonuclease SbcCD ATPase subunit